MIENMIENPFVQDGLIPVSNSRRIYAGYICMNMYAWYIYKVHVIDGVLQSPLSVGSKTCLDILIYNY